MIIDRKPISMPECLEYLQNPEGIEKDVKGFIKKFSKLDSEDAKEMRKNLEGLKMMKLKEENISKIIDLMPENSEDLNKIFIEMGLDENESKKILETVKQFK